MIRFLKSDLRWLSLPGLGVLLVFLAFLFRPKSIEYRMSTDQTMKMINQSSMQIAIKDIGSKQLIDIRSSELFALGHPENAINIPLRNLLNEESIEIYKQLLKDQKEAILFGSDELQAAAPWLLLQQLGYQNIKTLKGGFTSTNEFKEPVLSATEISIIDISSLREKTGPIESTDQKPEKTRQQIIVPVRKEVSSGGGC